MSDPGLITSGDLGFVVAAYGVILGGAGLYAFTLARRLRRATHAADNQTAQTHPAADLSVEPPADSIG